MSLLFKKKKIFEEDSSRGNCDGDKKFFYKSYFFS